MTSRKLFVSIFGLLLYGLLSAALSFCTIFLPVVISLVASESYFGWKLPDTILGTYEGEMTLPFLIVIYFFNVATIVLGILIQVRMWKGYFTED